MTQLHAAKHKNRHQDERYTLQVLGELPTIDAFSGLRAANMRQPARHVNCVLIARGVMRPARRGHAGEPQESGQYTNRQTTNIRGIASS